MNLFFHQFIKKCRSYALQSATPFLGMLWWQCSLCSSVSRKGTPRHTLQACTSSGLVFIGAVSLFNNLYIYHHSLLCCCFAGDLFACPILPLTVVVHVLSCPHAQVHVPSGWNSATSFLVLFSLYSFFILIYKCINWAFCLLLQDLHLLWLLQSKFCL